MNKDNYDNEPYTQCSKCDHFCDDEVHFEDGCQEFDHAPDPNGKTMLLKDWKIAHPELFKEHPDGCIGPNSEFHSRRGKDDALAALSK